MVTFCIFFLCGLRVCDLDWYHSNTDENIVGETGDNTVPLSKNSKRSMTLVDTESNSAGEDYFPLLKRFQTYSSKSKSQYEGSLLEDMLSYILKQFHSFFPDVELEDSKLQYNPVPGNATPLDEFLRGVLEENLKHSQMHRRINFHKIQQLELHVLGPMAKICQKLRILLSVKLIGLK